MLASSSRITVGRVSAIRAGLSLTVAQRYASSLASEYAVPKRRPAFQKGTRPQQKPSAKPWSTKPVTSFRPSPQDQTSRYNVRLGGALDHQGLARVLDICTEMKLKNVKPDLSTYHYILRGCARAHYNPEARAVVEDMELNGIEPDLQSYNYLLESAAYQSMDITDAIFEEILRKGLIPNETTFGLIIQRHCNGLNLEHALQVLADLQQRGMQATLSTYQAIIPLACDKGHPRLALDLAEEFEATTFRRLEASDWMHILVACAEDLYANGVQRCWSKIVDQMGVLPDEGTCIHVLHTAGRHGLPALGESALQCLRRMNVAWHEYHFAPLIEAFCRAKKPALREAFTSLQIMRDLGLNLTIETARPIFDLVRKDAETLEEAWAVLDDMHSADQKVDVAALNVLVQGAISLSDLPRAVGLYKAAPTLAVTPDAETFNLLLTGCIAAAHRDLGDRLMAEMKELGVSPNADTYERLVILCLTQDNYEDAFFYLEEMKAQKYAPSANLYDAVVRKCASVGDTRYEVALEEMREAGYSASNDTKMYIRSQFSPDVHGGEQAPAELTLDEKKAIFEAPDQQVKP